MHKKNHNLVSRERGAATITAVVFFIVISLAVAIGLSSPVVNEYKASRDFGKAKEAYYLSESGFEDVVYRIKQGSNTSATEILSLNGSSATTTTVTVNTSKKTVSSVGSVTANTRRVGASLSTGVGKNFVYGVHIGPFGLIMGTNATINGNVYSGGNVCGGGLPFWSDVDCARTTNEPWWTYGQSTITGTVVSTGTTGSNGLVARVVNQGGNSVYAGTITNSTISGSAYCDSIYTSSTSTCNTLAPQAVVDLPITTTEIDNWQHAAHEGVDDHTGCVAWSTYTVTTSRNMGPEQFKCNLTIQGPTTGTAITITLQGPVLVEGILRITGKVNVRVDPALVAQSVVMMADFPGVHLWNSNIILDDGYEKTFTGAPGGNSWVMLLSENEGVSLGERYDTAIKVGSNVSGDVILYARKGMIELGSASVAEIVGYGVHILDGAVVNYVLGLQNSLFYTGPDGSWLTEDWKLNP